MKVKNLWRIYVSVILLSIVAALFATVVFLRSASADHNTLDNLITFVVTILSMLVAVLAYHISVKTYISIDAVNAISKMDGNVMESENYSTSVFYLLRTFDALDKETASNDLLEHLKKKFEKHAIVSGARLADNIQQAIDIVVLLSFIIKRKSQEDVDEDGFNNGMIQSFDSLLLNMERMVKDLEQMSEGSCILMMESVKLLRAVYAYQCYKSGNLEREKVALLMDVRGTMLKNSISKTVYYNYLGLMYLDKSVTAMRNYLGVGQNYDILSIDAADLIREKRGLTKCDYVEICLNEAIADFERAASMINEDMMWNAFIQYNLARAQYIQKMINSSDDSVWLRTMERAIDYRFKLSMILQDVMGGKGVSFFQRAFEDQLKLSKLMCVRLKIASGISVDVPDELLDVGSDEFLRLGKIKQDIESYMNKV